MLSTRRRHLPHLAVAALVAASLAWWWAPVRGNGAFVPGDLVVVRIGTGSGSLSAAATAVFLDEYTRAGAAVQTVPMPTAPSGANASLTNSGSATSEGGLQRSVDGRYLTLAGYDAAPGTSGIASRGADTVNRIVGRVDAERNIDTTTRLTDYSGNNIRSAVTDDGSRFWTAGPSSGVRYVPLGNAAVSGVALNPLNTRVVGIYGGQLYASSQSGSNVGINAVGSGTPIVSSQPASLVAPPPNAYAFVFLDRDPSVPGVDTLYVADQTAGLLKYSFDGTRWTARGAVAGALTGLAARLNGDSVELYATSGTGAGNSIVSLIDSTAFDASLPTSAAFTTVAKAAANTVFRGLAFAPGDAAPVIATQPASQTVSAGAAATLGVVANGSGNLVYRWYQGARGDTGSPVGSNSPSFTTPALGAAAQYWVRVSNQAGSADSAAATIAVSAVSAPVITASPASQTVAPGSSAGLTVVATGAGLHYQWYAGASSDTSQPVGTDADSFTTPSLFASASYWVRVSNAAGVADSLAATIAVRTAACSATTVGIHDVQGPTDVSPKVGQAVTVKGVVVGDYEGPASTGALGGFFLQDLSPDADPATSEGIFVYEPSGADSVALGQVVQVTGSVSEYQGQTEITATAIDACGTTALVEPTDVLLPVPAPVNGVDYRERFEGMLVRFHQTLTVTEPYQLGRFGEVVLASGGRLSQPTSVAMPGAAAVAIESANDLNRILLDDGTNVQNPDPIVFARGTGPLSASNTLRGGDTVTDLVGLMTYGWGGASASPNAYRVRPINALNATVPTFVPANPRPASPNVAGRLTAAGVNVGNYFLTTGSASTCGQKGNRMQCRGASNATELQRQQAKLNAALVRLGADVIGMTELENTQRDNGADVNPLADIVTRLNATLGAGTYASIETGVIGTDAIRSGLIYKPAKVTPVSAPLVDGNAVHNRLPIAQVFQENLTGEKFTVVVNHLRSKGSCPSSGADADQNDGQGCLNWTRTQQAQATLDFVNTVVVPAAGDPDVLLLGDFNSYAKEDPIRAIEAAGYTNLIAQFSGGAAYSYAYGGEWGYLDQALASASLRAQVVGAAPYHINADEPSVLDYDTEFKSAGQLGSLFAPDEFRESDHDPIVVGLDLRPQPRAAADQYRAEAGTTTNVGPAQGVLANDSGGLVGIIGHTNPAHGALTLNGDGSFSYTPQPGYAGTDTFEYTVTNAAKVYRSTQAPLVTLGGVTIGGGAFGSSLAPVPGVPDEVYGLTDRGPNVDGPHSVKIEPIPGFTPAIGHLRLLPNGQAELLRLIPLTAPDGTPYNGQVNTQASTGETILDLDGNVLPTSPYGYDSEGLVALPDGTFWVSDEYGPFITHFDSTGRQVGRLAPFDGTLPAELARRVPNRGMEGLTITPDGSTLVGIMQSALQQADLGSIDAKKVSPVRIVTYRLADGATHEYLYLLDNPSATKTAVSEITALSNTTFLVDERDGNFPPGAYKKLHRVDLTGATDVGPSAPGYDAVHGGLLVGGKTIEALVGTQATSAATATLASHGIAPVSKTLHLDIGDLLTTLDPKARFFSHDKLEGVIAADGGNTIIVSNDSDFGIDGVTNDTAPFQLHPKVSPATGEQDEGEFLVIDMTKLPAATSTATVTIVTADTTPPDTALTAAPAAVTSSPTATIAFGGTDAGTGVASFECSLDGGPFVSCASPTSYTGLADGSHTVSVRAVDGAGNIDATPATASWVVDTVAPETALTGTPRASTDATTATFTFTGTDGASGVVALECSLDGASFAPCSSPVSLQGLASAPHTFAVRAVDAAGNRDGTPAAFTWTVGACASDVTRSLALAKSGFVFNPTTGRFSQTVKVTNITAAPIAGPLTLVFDGLSSNATIYHPDGTTACTTPSGSSFLVTALSPLAPGASASFAVQFVNPAKTGITYTARILTGAGVR